MSNSEENRSNLWIAASLGVAIGSIVGVGLTSKEIGGTLAKKVRHLFNNSADQEADREIQTSDISKPLKPKEISPFTNRLQKLQKRVPVVGDKALIDLVNGIQVSDEAVRYRRQQSFFGRLMEDTLGKGDRQLALLIQGNLIDGQLILRQLVLELYKSLEISQIGLRITQMCLVVTQQSLLETREAIRSNKQSLDQLMELINNINNISGTFEEIIYELERLNLRITAAEDFDRIVTAWAAKRTYRDLPWAVQITLLVREVFNSSVSAYELQSGDTQ